jgi:PAS domain S-box-containing protein
MLLVSALVLLMGPATSAADGQGSLWGDQSTLIVAVSVVLLALLVAVVVLLLVLAKQRKARSDAEQSRAILRAFVDSSGDAICIRDRERRLLVWNPAFARGMKVNCGVDVHAGMRVEDYLPAEILAGFKAQREMLSRAFGGEAQEAEFEFSSPTGRLLYLLTTWCPVRFGDGFSAVAEVTRDITESKTAESRLLEAERRYRTVADFTRDWEYWEDPEGALIYVSPSCERITGYPAKEFVQNPQLILDLVSDEDRRAWLDHQCHSDRGDGGPTQFRIRTKGGEMRWLEHVCARVTDEDGTFRGVRGSNRDITARKRTEQTLADAERDRKLLRDQMTHQARVTAMGELASSIAHELRQPLTAILSNAQAASRFLSRSEPDLEEVRDALEDIIADDQRAADVIRRIRSLVRKTEMRRNSVDVNEAIVEVVDLVRSEVIRRGITVNLSLEDTVPVASADRVQLQQVVLNLVNNSLEAVEALPRGTAELELRSFLKADVLEVTVRDNGPPVEEAALEHMTEAFHTTKPDGLGMGLSVSRSIIEAHGGTLWPTRNPNGGLTMHFTLPVASEQEA